MNANDKTAGGCGSFLETLAAEFTDAAYPVALRHGIDGSWLELELDLWKVLNATVQKWGRESSRAGRPILFEVWRAALLAELTAAAYRAARRQGVKGPLLEVELNLYQAFRAVIEDAGRKELPAGACGLAFLGDTPRGWPMKRDFNGTGLSPTP
jgi:hypothetical protein